MFWAQIIIISALDDRTKVSLAPEFDFNKNCYFLSQLIEVV